MRRTRPLSSFSALQRAEIAEMVTRTPTVTRTPSFSALQRAEIAEMRTARRPRHTDRCGFSALQRAEIAEMLLTRTIKMRPAVSVLFNEPKLLK